jgi:signal transduction histidine kinase
MNRIVAGSRRLPPAVADGLLAAFFSVLAQVELHVEADDGYRGGPLWLNGPLEAVFTVLLLLRSAFPRTTLLLMCAWMVLPTLATTHTLLFWGNFLPLMLVNYTVARNDGGRLGRWSWAVCVASMMTLAIRFSELRSASAVAFPLVMFGATSALGALVRHLARQHEELARALSQLAEQQRIRETEAVEAERRRIAIEMHDVVAHAVSLMAVQVGAARLQLESVNAPVPSQLRAAEETGRGAIADLRRSLGVMQGRGSAGDLDPVPDLSGLTALVARFEDAGLEVEVDRNDDGALPPSVQLVVYRIVQESLTNALKHAGRTRATVSVRQSAESVAVAVTNSVGVGPIAEPHGGGHGLAGMRERVAMYDGELRADATPDGGFAVTARLPLAAGTHVPVQDVGMAATPVGPA